jgi:deazaflavin-dependent oxidoreductase (nitroreductase family)
MAQADKVREHVELYRATNGAEGHMWDRLGAKGTYPCLLLTTIGRKTHIARTTPLVYGRDGDNYVVIASKGGRPTHPAWYLNLTDNPQVVIQVGPDLRSVVAHSADGAERARLWQAMKSVYPLYDDYEAKIGSARVIPVVVLTPN